MDSVVITGATSGIGLEAARLLAEDGFAILAVGHSAANCERADAAIRAKVPGAQIEWFWADLMQKREVLRAADAIRASLGRRGGALYALINNAGCARNRYMRTQDGHEQLFALNCLAPFLLTRELLPHLLSARGRVIVTSSKSHKGARVHWKDVMFSHLYDPLAAYKQSKLGNVLFARGLDILYADRGLRAYAVDPGLVDTDIGNKAGGIVSAVWSVRRRFGDPPEVPARTYRFLCARGEPPQGLYFRDMRSARFSRRVTDENALRFLKLCGELCGGSLPNG